MPDIPAQSVNGQPPTVSWAGRLLGDVAAIGALAVAKPLTKLGLRSPPDGWRRLTEVGLRTEASKFALSSFGVNVPQGPEGEEASPEERFVRRLAEFLRNEPLARCVMNHGRSTSQATSGGVVDLIVAYPQQPKLVGVFDADVPTSDHEAHERLTAATHISFAAPVGSPDATERFIPPDFAARPAMPRSPLNVVCRLSPDGTSADVWVQFHHAAADGAPGQELLVRLEHAWGLSEPRPTFPTPDAFAPHAPMPRLASSPGAEREIWQAHDFVDFTPLLALRQNLLERPDVRAGGGITLATLLIWCLAHQPEFAGRKFASMVDVPPTANGRNPRGVHLLTIKPSDFFGEASRAAAMVAYAHEAAHLLGETRARRSVPCVATDTLALLPPGLQIRSIRNHIGRANDTYGTIGLSVIRDAKVFVAPMSDVGFDDGFIAVGSMLLPAAGGRVVGAVTIKGSKEKVSAYPAAIRRAVAGCRGYV